MAISQLPLGYCANVHAGRTFAETMAALEKYAVPLRRRLQEPMAIGLWLPRSVMDEVSHSAEQAAGLRRFLSEHDLACYTMNAFPFGDFHAERVKEQVYLPDWSTADRVDYTLQCAELLATLLPDGVEGSISTSPLAFKRLHSKPQGVDRYILRIIELANGLAAIEKRTGKTIRLAIEPEPLCLLETTVETIAFFDHLRSRASSDQESTALTNHIGVCFDICHQAVEFESIAYSIALLETAKIRLVKIHVTNALELSDAGDVDARRELANFVEPRYLHQTIALHSDGRRLTLEDLTVEHAMNPPAEWLEAKTWRIHFHVPVDRESMGGLRTTRPALRDALDSVAVLGYTPHLEVETYTWNVLSESTASRFDLVEGLAAELLATRQLLSVSKARS